MIANPGSHIVRDMGRRVARQARAKLVLTVVLNILFWVGYASLGRWAVFPLHVLPTLWIDAVIPFQPRPWVYIYLSQFLFTSGLPWLLTTAEELRRYVRGVLFLCGVSFAIFFFYPVASPRPAGVENNAAMQWILRYDGPLNAFPSLHAGFLVYLGALGWRIFGKVLPTTVIIAAAIWATLILYATIATRQHYAVDLFAGGLIGYGADWFAWRRQRGASAAAATPRSSGVASQPGWK